MPLHCQGFMLTHRVNKDFTFKLYMYCKELTKKKKEPRRMNTVQKWGININAHNNGPLQQIVKDKKNLQMIWLTTLFSKVMCLFVIGGKGSTGGS